MNTTLADLTLLAVTQFWDQIRQFDDFNLSFADKVQSSLYEIASQPAKSSSQAWAAVMFCVDARRIAEALQTPSKTPPAELIATVGYSYWRGGCIDIDAASPPSTDRRDHAADLAKLKSLPLDDQSICEIVLALKGTKISRLTGRLEDFWITSRVLDYPVFISSQGLKAVADNSLNGFSNLANEAGEIDIQDGHQEVFAYFGGSLGDRAIVTVLDRINAAGAFLQIPECCRRYFKANWDHAASAFDGDLAYKMVSSQENWETQESISIAWQCNPYAMYQGASLLFHFPCNPRCANSIQLVNDRFALISQLDPDLAGRCRAAHQRPVRIASNRAFQIEQDIKSETFNKMHAESRKVRFLVPETL